MMSPWHYNDVSNYVMLLYKTYETIYLTFFWITSLNSYKTDIISYKTLVFHRASLATPMFRHDVIKNVGSIFKTFLQKNVSKKCFFPWLSPNYRTSGEGGRHFLNSSLPLVMTSQTLRHYLGKYCDYCRPLKWMFTSKG